jgi:hypothetical protein
LRCGNQGNQTLEQNGLIMAIDKLSTPFDPAEVDDEAIEIVIEDPESVSIFDEEGGMIIDFDPDAGELMGMSHDANLAEFMGESELDILSRELTGRTPILGA